MADLIEQPSSRAQRYRLLELLRRNITVLLALDIHDVAASVVDPGKLRGRGVAVAAGLVWNLVRIVGRVLIQHFLRPLARNIGPDWLAEQDHLHAFALGVLDCLMQFLPRAQSRVGIEARVAAVLAADLPAHKLNRSHTVGSALVNI